MKNSTGGNRSVKEELRFLQKLFGKSCIPKDFLWMYISHFPHPTEEKVLGKKSSNYF